MRVHMRNVMEAALERGVVTGYHVAHKAASARHNQHKTQKAVETILAAIWESVDEIIDFSDDDDDTKRDSRPIGFKSHTDLVGSMMTPQHTEVDDEDDVDEFPFD